jgi:16S rRNA (guanine966-N2)-methyltransferase
VSLKILGGTLKGIDIKSHPSSSKKSGLTRPTSVMLRRKFFDANQNLQGWHFIDLCAGTGTMAFEALSRGASSILCNEISKSNIPLLKKNIQIIHQVLPDAIIELTCGSFHRTLERQFEKNTILFFDPPYEKESLYQDFSLWLKEFGMKGSLVIIEFCRQKTMSVEKMVELFGVPDKSYQQGTSFLTVYHL